MALLRRRAVTISAVTRQTAKSTQAITPSIVDLLLEREDMRKRGR